MKKLYISLLITAVFYTAMAYAQSDTDTDPNRWERVKSWKGTVSLSCTSQDDATKVEPGGTTIISKVNDDVDATVTLDQHVIPLDGSYAWGGSGQVSGSISEKLETISSKGNTDCIIDTESGELAPIAVTSGNILEWFRQGQTVGNIIL